MQFIVTRYYFDQSQRKNCNTEAYIRHSLMRYYLDLVKIVARYEIIIAWYEIIKRVMRKLSRHMRYYNEIMQYL